MVVGVYNNGSEDETITRQNKIRERHKTSTLKQRSNEPLKPRSPSTTNPHHWLTAGTRWLGFPSMLNSYWCHIFSFILLMDKRFLRQWVNNGKNEQPNVLKTSHCQNNKVTMSYRIVLFLSLLTTRTKKGTPRAARLFLCIQLPLHITRQTGNFP